MCTANVEATGGVVITFVGHVRGIWRHKGGTFSFTPGGYVSPTFTTPHLEEAVRHSLDVICKG